MADEMIAPDFDDEPVPDFEEPRNSPAECERLHQLDRVRYVADKKLKRGYDVDGETWACPLGAACRCEWCRNLGVLACGACDPALQNTDRTAWMRHEPRQRGKA